MLFPGPYSKWEADFEPKLCGHQWVPWPRWRCIYLVGDGWWFDWHVSTTTLGWLTCAYFWDSATTNQFYILMIIPLSNYLFCWLYHWYIATNHQPVIQWWNSDTQMSNRPRMWPAQWWPRLWKRTLCLLAWHSFAITGLTKALNMVTSLQRPQSYGWLLKIVTIGWFGGTSIWRNHQIAIATLTTAIHK